MLFLKKEMKISVFKVQIFFSNLNINNYNTITAKSLESFLNALLIKVQLILTVFEIYGKK